MWSFSLDTSQIFRKVLDDEALAHFSVRVPKPPVDVPYASLPASKKPLMLRVEMADAQTGDVLLKSYSVPVEFPDRANE